MSPAGVPVWQACHCRDLWRDFPAHLAEAVEREYQSWVEGGSRPHIAVAYVWERCWGKADEKFIEYEITFHDMRQQRVTPPGSTRKIRRLLAPSQ